VARDVLLEATARYWAVQSERVAKREEVREKGLVVTETSHELKSVSGQAWDPGWDRRRFV
jgi:hypothetical protein